MEGPGVAICLSQFGTPEMQGALRALLSAGAESMAWLEAVGATFSEIASRLGKPALSGGITKAPFDVIGDTLRGVRGVIMDMFRRPDEVLEACDRLAPIMVKWVTRRSNPYTSPLVFMPLHKGADSFMSAEQFQKFYWPSLKKVIEGLVADGFVPYLFAEGAYGTRLETIAADLPKGRTVWQFDRTDMKKAKQIMGGTACIQGNVPGSLLQLGTADEVTAYCRDLIENVGPGGGFILDVGAVLDDAKPVNVEAMIQAAKDSAK
jgi:uroporphyrinogen-III decarboxylase